MQPGGPFRTTRGADPKGVKTILADNNMATMITNANLRGLLRTGRRQLHFSQKEAALAAGVSPTWWRRVESAYETVVATETLADMLDAVNVRFQHLILIGEPELAEMVRSLQRFRNAEDNSEKLEDYLMSAPASEEMRRELVTWVRTREALTFRTEPFADEFSSEAKESENG